MPRTQRNPSRTGSPRRIGIARVLSKRGLCSRSEAARWVEAGRVKVNGRVVSDPEHPVIEERDRIIIDDLPSQAAKPVHILLNKPRGLVCSANDERGRDTVYHCFDGADLPWIAPVGRLDQASEGALLFSNDPEWAAGITDPAVGLDKTYHVQIDCVPDEPMLQTLLTGCVDAGEQLSAKSVRLLRHGQRNAWLEIILDEGRNRQIRRLLKANGMAVKRLLRVAIGPLALGQLGKGCWRELTREEVAALRRHATTT